MIKLLLQIDAPKPDPEAHPRSLEERVEDALDLIDSGHESRADWHFVVCLYRKLKQLKDIGRLSPRGLELLKAMSPVVNKYAHQSGNKITIDPELAHL